MDDKTRIICNIYNLRRKSGARQRPSGSKDDEEGLVKDMMFGVEKNGICVKSGAKQF
jgi:hypothetical protein